MQRHEGASDLRQAAHQLAQLRRAELFLRSARKQRLAHIGEQARLLLLGEELSVHVEQLGDAGDQAEGQRPLVALELAVVARRERERARHRALSHAALLAQAAQPRSEKRLGHMFPSTPDAGARLAFASSA